MLYDAFVFDLDGTLTESAPGIMGSVAYALNKLNRPVPDEKTLEEFVGPPLADSFIKYCDMTRAQALEAIKFYKERHLTIGWKQAPPYPGIFELLRALKRAGAWVALASSKPLDLCRKTLEHFALLGFFDKLSAPADSAVNADKAALIRDALPDTYARAVMVGDRMFDMRGAKTAGIRAIGALYGYGSREELIASGADELAQTPEALFEMLLPGAEKPRGVFISFEGPDGCGKSTQIQLLYDWLSRSGAPVTLTREPGGCPISERVRALVLDVKALGMSDECEALLFAASRAQHVKDVIRPALERGNIVLCDRFVDSSVAYQGAGRALGADWIRLINAPGVAGCMPDLTIFLDLDPEEALKRRVAAGAPDRIERCDSAFALRVYDGFVRLITDAPARFRRVDARGGIEQIQAEIRQIVVSHICS